MQCAEWALDLGAGNTCPQIESVEKAAERRFFESYGFWLALMLPGGKPQIV